MLRRASLWQKMKAIKPKQYLLFGTALIVVLLLFALRHYLLLLALLAVNIASSAILKTVRRNQIGVEMVMFSTVISGVLYGPAIGAVIGAVSMLIDYAFATRLSFFSIVTVPSYAAAGYISGLVGNSISITRLGISITIIYVLFTNTIIVAFMGGTLSKSIRFAATDVAFNAVMFSTVAPFVLNLTS
ncbi:MAG: hypothetical protein V1702_06090 [Candidatus Woesearchaeota archaeon]